MGHHIGSHRYWHVAWAMFMGCSVVVPGSQEVSCSDANHPSRTQQDLDADVTVASAAVLISMSVL